MKVLFFLNYSQEDEGAEYEYFPAVNFSESDVQSKEVYYRVAAYFIQSLNSVDLAVRMLKIIESYNEENMILELKGETWNKVRFLIEGDYIMFKLIKSESFLDIGFVGYVIMILYIYFLFLKVVFFISRKGAFFLPLNFTSSLYR